MRGSILQPGYLPWLGFFEQFFVSDIFVFLDDVQYTKQDWRNRNRIRSDTVPGWSWLTVPVKVSNRRIKICEVKIDYSRNWIKRHLNLIRQHYRTSPYFNEVFAIIAEGLKRRHIYLSDLTIDLVLGLCGYLGIGRKTLRASDLVIGEADKNMRLITICRQTGIDLFYDGQKARTFLDADLFARHGIRVVFQRYGHPSYQQFYKPFIPYLSIVDLIFSRGRESIHILSQDTDPAGFQDMLRAENNSGGLC
jgi:hypothetical protein